MCISLLFYYEACVLGEKRELVAVFWTNEIHVFDDLFHSCVDRKSSDLGFGGMQREYLQTDCAINVVCLPPFFPLLHTQLWLHVVVHA